MCHKAATEGQTSRIIETVESRVLKMGMDVMGINVVWWMELGFEISLVVVCQLRSMGMMDILGLYRCLQTEGVPNGWSEVRR